jgi:hypothetical protein
MANLILNDFRCVEETYEAGWDSPYFVTFIGHPSTTAPTSNVITTRKDSWDNNIGSGSYRAPQMPVASDVDTTTLVLVGLMEEDVNPDIIGSGLKKVRDEMTVLFKGPGSVGGISLTQLGALMKPIFRDTLINFCTNDEQIDVHRLPITTLSGILPLLHFFGWDGHYRVRFKMA